MKIMIDQIPESTTEIERLSSAIANALRAYGPIDPGDLMAVASAILTATGQKLGAEPHVTLAAFLLRHCDGDRGKAIESIGLAALASDIVNAGQVTR